MKSRIAVLLLAIVLGLGFILVRSRPPLREQAFDRGPSPELPVKPEIPRYDEPTAFPGLVKESRMIQSGELYVSVILQTVAERQRCVVVISKRNDSKPIPVSQVKTEAFDSKGKSLELNPIHQDGEFLLEVGGAGSTANAMYDLTENQAQDVKTVKVRLLGKTLDFKIE